MHKLFNLLPQHYSPATAPTATSLCDLAPPTPKVIELCGRINNDPRRRIKIHPSIGMHPEKADLETLDGVLSLIDEHAGSIVCVGEVGLDYSRHLIGEAGGDGTERAKAVQREVFVRQARRAEVLLEFVERTKLFYSLAKSTLGDFRARQGDCASDSVLENINTMLGMTSEGREEASTQAEKALCRERQQGLEQEIARKIRETNYTKVARRANTTYVRRRVR